jgi:hypothetical protein
VTFIPGAAFLEGGELYGSAAPAGRPALRTQSVPQISGVYHGRAQHASLIGGDQRSNSGSLAKFTANRRASSRVSRFGRARLALETTLKLQGVSQIVQPTTARSGLYGAASDSEVLGGRAGVVFDLLGQDAQRYRSSEPINPSFSACQSAKPQCGAFKVV